MARNQKLLSLWWLDKFLHDEIYEDRQRYMDTIKVKMGYLL